MTHWQMSTAEGYIAVVSVEDGERLGRLSERLGEAEAIITALAENGCPFTRHERELLVVWLRRGRRSKHQPCCA